MRESALRLDRGTKIRHFRIILNIVNLNIAAGTDDDDKNECEVLQKCFQCDLCEH